jgi:hypothetical protein
VGGRGGSGRCVVDLRDLSKLQRAPLGAASSGSQAVGLKKLDVDPASRPQLHRGGMNRETEKQLFGLTRGTLQLSLSR